MANSLDSLRTLANGPSTGGDLLRGRDLAEQRLREMKRNISHNGQGYLAGANRNDVADLEGSLDSDPTLGVDAQALNHEMQNYARPDVTARRQQVQGDKMALAGEPARVAGEANVRAAEVSGDNRFRALQEMLTGGGGGRMSVTGVGSIAPNPMDLQTQKDAAASQRITQTGQQQSIQQQIKDLLKKRSTGFLGMGGNATETDAQIATLSGGGNTSTVAMITPDGRPINVPLDRVAEVEARGARRQ
jgi:hypothetical protein